MTAKERVLKKYPNAYCDAWDGGALVWPSRSAFDDRPELGRGRTAEAAWKAASERSDIQERK